MIGQLPKELEVNGKLLKIRYDFRACLDILCAYADPDLLDYEKVMVAFKIFYIDKVEDKDYEEAYNKMLWFLNLGDMITEENVRNYKLYDWEQDEQIIFAAVNKVAGYETRATKELHFWTFISYFYEIGDGTFSYITSIRNKLRKNEKLDKSEKEYYKENESRIKLHKKQSKREKDITDKLNKLLD